NHIDKGNLKMRLIFAAVIIVVIVGFGILGGWFWFGLIFALSMGGLWEFYRAFEMELSPQGIAGYLLGTVYWLFLALDKLDFLFPTLIVGFLVLMAVYVFLYTKSTLTKAFASYIGFLYAVVMLSYLYRIRVGTDGIVLIWLVFLAPWGSDVMAYFFGSLLGKHKMVPHLSKNKTWEGTFGGIFGSALAGLLFGLIAGRHFNDILTPILACTVISAGAGIISVFGDLFASAIKRQTGIKDFSKLIPGHGGILDRFDSVIFVAPLFYYLAQIFIAH
ncbi:MAG: phosphatidate cytidylyltransferase, partial [Lachnospiraceae bacterium]|nr:phosphatidate cytidylyltransferase [Lachnospiraceae bacterium]